LEGNDQETGLAKLIAGVGEAARTGESREVSLRCRLTEGVHRDKDESRAKAVRILERERGMKVNLDD